MKKNLVSGLSVFLLALFALASCKKNVDKKADEDLAASVSGRYDMNYLSLNGSGGSLPTDSLSGKIDVVKKGENQVAMNLSLTQLGSAPEEETLDNIEVKNENSAVGLYSGSDKIGTINGNDLELNIAGNGQEVIFRARKK